MLDYCPKQGKQNSKHKAHARRATKPTHQPQANQQPPWHQPLGYTPQCRQNARPHAPIFNCFASPSTSRETRTRTPNRAPAFEAGASTNSATLAKRGAETNTSNNPATTVRPTSGTHAHQPHHRPAQPACADTLNRPTQTGPTYSPTPRAPWRKHPSATRTHPAHHQCRHTPPARQHPQPRASPHCFRSPVGVAGLEPAASSSRTKRATKLRHTPKTGKNFSFHYLVQFSFDGSNRSTLTRHCQNQSRMWDSNPQHLVYKTSTLPVELIRPNHAHSHYNTSGA